MLSELEVGIAARADTGLLQRGREERSLPMRLRRAHLLAETRRRTGRMDSAKPFSIVCERSLLCSVLRWTPSAFDAWVTFPRLADMAATMYLPSNASTACSSVIPFPISSRMIWFKRSSMLLPSIVLV